MNNMKPTGSVVPIVDEMFSDDVGANFMDDEAVGGGPTFTADSNREGVHADFNNDFGDLFDDDDLS